MFRTILAKTQPTMTALIMGLILCQSQLARAGSLIGSLELSGLPASVNLTTEGTQDWAVWGVGTFPSLGSLTPDARKAIGGVAVGQISDLTELRGGTVSNFGQFTPGPTFSWSDGTPTPAGSSAEAMLVTRGNRVGSGFSLTVRADTTARTLKLYTQAFQADAKLVASLSDGSAVAYDSVIAGDIYSTHGVDLPSVYSLTYSADSPGETLTVAFEMIADHNGRRPYESVGIGAATLSAAVPEPGSLLVWGSLLLGGIGYVQSRRKWSSKPSEEAS